MDFKKAFKLVFISFLLLVLMGCSDKKETKAQEQESIVDNTKPVITLMGNKTIELVQGTPYTEKGATAIDDVDGEIDVLISGVVDIDTIGSYSITYRAKDSAQNQANEVTRTINVVVIPDIESPIITLKGDNTITLVQGTAYNEAGATATDDRDGTVTVTTSGTVDINTVGTYTLTYKAKDSAGNEAVATRTVKVILAPDTTKPVITLNGEHPMELTKGTAYSESGATATDDRDGTVTVTTSGTVDINTVGTYTLTYKAKDSAGNEATATRTVKVILAPDTTTPTITADTTKPVITLNGENSMELTKGTAYSEAGATATDDRDGTVTVTTSGTVDINTVGTYTLTYKAKDTAGNEVVVTRTVNVVALAVEKTIIKGFVIDDPIENATIEVYESNQTLIGTFTNSSAKDGNFSISLDGKYSFPLLLKVTDGQLNGSEFNDVMYGTCFETNCNITPITTILSLSFISNISSSSQGDFSKFALENLGIAEWQSVSQKEIKNFRQYLKDNNEGIEYIASVIANDIADGYVDNSALKSIFPNAKFREEKVSSFEIDKDALKNIEERNFKLMNLITGEESDIDGSVSYKNYGLELALLKKLEYKLYDGTPKTKMDIVYLPFEEYSKTKLNSYSTIFNFVFKDSLLITLNSSTKKRLVNILMTKYRDELEKLVAIHQLYINKGDIYLSDFESGIESLQSLLKREYTNTTAIMNYSTATALKSKQVQKISRAYTKPEVYTDFMSLGGIALKHKQTGDNEFSVGNILPAYWGLTTYDDYKTFISNGGDSFFNVTTLPSTFNHNLINPNSGGGIGLVFSQTLKSIASSKNFGNGAKTPMRCEEFDGSLCDGTTLYTNQKRDYVFYKDMRLSSLQGLMNDLDVLKSIIGFVPGKEKVDEAIKKAKKAKKVIEDVAEKVSIASMIVDSSVDALEIVNQADILDVETKNKLQENINSYKNVRGNIDEVVSTLSSFSLTSQDTLKDTKLEKIWSNPKDVTQYLQLLGFDNTANATSLLLLPSSSKDIKEKAGYMLTALMLYATIGNQEIFEEQYDKFSKKDGAIFFKTNHLLEQIYLMINSLAIKKDALKKSYVLELKKKGLIDKTKSAKYLLHTASSKIASLLFKGVLTPTYSKNKLSEIPKVIASKITDFKSTAIFVKFITGKIDDITFMGAKEKMSMIVDNIIVPMLYNGIESLGNAAKDLIVKKLIILATPQGASVALAEAGNEIAGKVVAMTAYPNKIAFELETKEDGNVYFNSLVPTVTGFNKGILTPWVSEDKKMSSAFLKAEGGNNPYVIVTKDENPPYYRPFYQTIFMGTKGIVETFLDDEVNEDKFIEVNWQYRKCTADAISENSVDIEKCNQFESGLSDNSLSASFTGENLDNDTSIVRDDFIKKSTDGNSYFDYIDALAYKVCQEATKLGSIRCSDDKSNFNIYNKTSGIFMDTLNTKIFNIKKKSDGSAVDSPKVKELFFKIVDKSKIDVDISREENNIVIKNNSNIDFSTIIVKSSAFEKFYISSFQTIERKIKAHETLTISFQEIETYLGKEEDAFDIDILVVDNILESYKKYLGDTTLVSTLNKMKPQGIGATLKSFIDAYSDESTQTYAFIRKEHMSLEKINHRPTIEPIEIIGDNIPAPAEVTFNIKATDEDNDALECWIKFTNDDEPTKLDSCEETVKHSYDKDGISNVTVIAKDSYGLESNYSDKVRLFNKNLNVVMLVDLSGSYSDDLNTFRTNSQNIIDAIKTSLPDYNLKIGITSFDDYPIYPYGASGDYAFKKELDLTDDIDIFKNTLNGLHVYNGKDEPEAQLEGIYQTIKQITWDDNSQKIILFFTDTSFHDKDKYPSDSSYPGHGSAETKALISDENAYIIGLASGNMSEDMKEISDFSTLMSSNSSEVVDKILDQLSVFSSDKIESRSVREPINSPVKVYTKDEYIGRTN